MKKYTVVCSSITGFNGKILLKGQICRDIDLINIEEHLAAGHIAEYAEPAQEEVKEDTKKKK